MSLQAFVSRRVVTQGGVHPRAILVRDGVISKVLGVDQIPAGTEVHDFGDAVILPGLVDSHVHINDPGRADWEGFDTATRAAAAGGYTTLVDMPLNCLPATTTTSGLAAKREAAEGRCWVDWGCWGGIVNDVRVDVEALAEAGALGFKCFLIHPGIDGFTMVNEAELRDVLPRIARTGLPLLVHAELPGPIEEAAKKLERSDWSRYSTYLQSRPAESEILAIQLMLSLCREYRFRLHIVHLSAAEAIPELRAARAEGLPVTVETCPHYLHFCTEEIPDGATLLKCAPPIREQENREHLWQALRDGIIDLIVTDHSPCPPAMKRLGEGDFRSAWGGIAGLSLALPLIWTNASRRGFQLTDLARWMSEHPARLAGCHEIKGQITEGYFADLVVFEPEEEFVVTEDRLHYRHHVSPYLGEKLKGVVQATFLRGAAVYRGGEFCPQPSGREFCRGAAWSDSSDRSFA